jgi:hypothetical protein
MRDSQTAKKGTGIWFIPALIFVLIAALAAEAKPAEQLSELMKLSSLDMFFGQIGDHLKMRMKEALPSNPLGAARKDKIIAGLDRAADRAFAPETLKQEFLLALDGEVTEADLDSVLAFYKSPLGARMKAWEKESQTADARAKIVKMTRELLDQLKDQPERAEVLKLIDGSLRLTELSTDAAFNTDRATAIGVVAADEKTTALTSQAVESIDTDMQKTRPAMTAQMRVNTLRFMAYIYREATIEELRQYLEFAASPVGKRYYGAVAPAMNKVLFKAGEEFGYALMRELGKGHT